MRKIFVLSKASRLTHMRIGEYIALVAAAAMLAVGVLLETCLADKMAFAERTKRFIRKHVREKVFA